VRGGGRERPDAKPIDVRQEAWNTAADFTGGDAGGGDTDVERMKHMDDYVEKKKEPGSANILHARRQFPCCQWLDMRLRAAYAIFGETPLRLSRGFRGFASVCHAPFFYLSGCSH